MHTAAWQEQFNRDVVNALRELAKLVAPIISQWEQRTLGDVINRVEEAQRARVEAE